ncbi:MAM domain-containing glycosylphosphatidylinositol anchor protein 1-like [Mercenaria mercenaria]|uniref:MAM domain-containing glycosylphosphatidylinositol anchor protein 1-like n=1 Tax=Mercenaria mercenaria TaxID=6596 RepID=UPI00234EC464|nr:MAM domain-containing glycosylphosphatidylinositol anchor protein 1-like [Mercenaria mercenaria]
MPVFHRLSYRQTGRCVSSFGIICLATDLDDYSYLYRTRVRKMETQLFKEAGDKGAQWNKASVTIARDSVPNDYKIVLMADVGATYHGDTAVDDLIIHDGPCQGIV